MSKISVIILVTGLFIALIAGQAYAQEQYIGAVPVNYIPSFAGNANQSRISSYSTYQSIMSSKVFSQTLSYDDFLPKLSTGFGIKAEYQNFKAGDFYSSSIMKAELIVAPKISIKGKYTISPGFALTYAKQSFETDTSVSSFFIGDTTISNFNYKASLLFNSKKFYAGYTWEISPLNLVLGYSSGFFHHHYIQAGYTYQRSEESKFAFTPQVLLKFHFWNDKVNRFLQLVPTLNLNFRYEQFLGGIGNRHIMLGWQNDKLKVMGIFHRNFQRNAVMIGTPGSFSVSIRYLIGNKRS